MSPSNQINAPSHLNATSYGVTEIILPQSESYTHMLFPMLAHLSHQTADRWLTWIAPPPQLSKNILEQYGFNLERLRLVYTRTQEDIPWVLWDALVTGNSQTVVASPGNLLHVELQKFELAAQQGQSQGLFIRYR